MKLKKRHIALVANFNTYYYSYSEFYLTVKVKEGKFDLFKLIIETFILAYSYEYCLILKHSTRKTISIL